MRRTGLVALGLVWLVAMGWAFESGRRVEAEYRAAVGAFAGEGDVAVALARYERGLFGSEVVTVLGPTTLAEGETSALRLVVRQRIAHGPYPLRWVFSDAFDGRPIAARLEAEPTLEIEHADVIEEVPLPLAIHALFGRHHAAISITPEIEATALEDPELSADWAAMHAELAFAYDGAELSGELAVPRIAFDGEHGSLRLEGARLALELVRAAGGAFPAFTGSARLRVGLLSIVGSDGGFTLRGLGIENASEVSQGNWSLRVDGSLGALEVRGGAPALTTQRLGGGELSLRLAGIALEPLAELEAISQGIQAEGPGSDAAQAELLAAVGALWPRLMAPGPELEMSRLRVETPEGELRMAFRAAVDRSEPAFLAHPWVTLPALELDLELSLPRALLEGWLASPRPVTSPDGGAAAWVVPAELATRRIETWLERGHLDVHADRYVTSVRMRQGVVRLNGRVVSFDAL